MAGSFRAMWKQGSHRKQSIMELGSKTSEVSSCPPALSHRNFLSDWIEIDMTSALGSGSYGDVFLGKVVGGPWRGTQAVVKRANPMNRISKIDQGEEEQVSTSAERFFRIECFMNRIIARRRPEIAARYLGECNKEGTRWLVWAYESDQTLDDLFEQAHQEGSIRPFIHALGINETSGDDTSFSHHVCSQVAIRLLELNLQLTDLGITHRDMKPHNILVCPAEKKLKLIDFGAAAMMQVGRGNHSWRVGYDKDRGPCDDKYSAPEELVEEKHWEVYDTYSVGLLLVRLVFRELWDSDEFSVFLEAFREAKKNLDILFTTLALQSTEISPAKTEEVMARSTRLNKNLFTRISKKGMTRSQEYIELAENACKVSWDDSPVSLDLCSFRDGLQILDSPAGLTWELLRRLLAKEPSLRIRPREAIALITTPPPQQKATKKRDDTVYHALKKELQALREEHKSINEEADRLSAGAYPDALVAMQLRGMKKKKLLLKDRIAQLELMVQERLQDT